MLHSFSRGGRGAGVSLVPGEGGGSPWSGGVLPGPGEGGLPGPGEGGLPGPGGGLLGPGRVLLGPGGGSPWLGGFSLVPGGGSPWSRGGFSGDPPPVNRMNDRHL